MKRTSKRDIWDFVGTTAIVIRPTRAGYEFGAIDNAVTMAGIATSRWHCGGLTVRQPGRCELRRCLARYVGARLVGTIAHALAAECGARVEYVRKQPTIR